MREQQQPDHLLHHIRLVSSPGHVDFVLCEMDATSCRLATARYERIESSSSDASDQKAGKSETSRQPMG
jgi:hypothetical protein